MRGGVGGGKGGVRGGFMGRGREGVGDGMGWLGVVRGGG